MKIKQKLDHQSPPPNKNSSVPTGNKRIGEGEENSPGGREVIAVVAVAVADDGMPVAARAEPGGTAAAKE